MMGALFFADIVTTGTVFDLGVGSGIGDFDSRLQFEYLEEVHGRKESRTLRRDYGLFEAAFVASPAWRCINLIVEVSRLASTEGIAEEIKQLEELTLPRYVAWTDVREAILVSGKKSVVHELGKDGEFLRYALAESGAIIHVLDDGKSARSDQPGSGDVWSISLTSIGIEY